MAIQARRPETQVKTVGSVTSSTTITPGTRLTIPTPESVREPAMLARLLLEIQAAVRRALSLILSKHDLGGRLYRDLVFAAGETKVLKHALGGPYKGWRWERPRALGGAVILEEQVQSPSSLDRTQLTVKSTNACKVDIYLWGG